MVDEDVVSGHVELELDDDRTAGGHRHRLDTAGRWAEHVAERVDPIEDFPDDME